MGRQARTQSMTHKPFMGVLQHDIRWFTASRLRRYADDKPELKLGPSIRHNQALHCLTASLMDIPEATGGYLSDESATPGMGRVQLTPWPQRGSILVPVPKCLRTESITPGLSRVRLTP